MLILETKNKKHQQWMCDVFNIAFSVGDTMLLEDDFGTDHEIILTGEAKLISNEAAAWASGFGSYKLDRFKPINDE